MGSDRFASRHAQTVNWALKTKEVGIIANETIGRHLKSLDESVSEKSVLSTRSVAVLELAGP